MYHTLVLSSEPFSSKYTNKAQKSQAQGIHSASGCTKCGETATHFTQH